MSTDTAEGHSISNDARDTWLAGVASVRADELVRTTVSVRGGFINFAHHALELSSIRRIFVCGAGKASPQMALGLEQAIGRQTAVEKQLYGVVNATEGASPHPQRIDVRSVRPLARNLPTAEAVESTRHICQLLTQLHPDDLCVCLFSGGGSALLASPAGEVTIDEKIQLVEFLQGRGANIFELNAVRSAISTVKGGRLRDFCRASRVVSLVLSDVIGDRLDVIASGPTAPPPAGAMTAEAVLQKYDPQRTLVAESIYRTIAHSTIKPNPANQNLKLCHLVIGNNQTAVAAAVSYARDLGYPAQGQTNDGDASAEEVGRELADILTANLLKGQKFCFVSGGEPTVDFAASDRIGLGGRNQHLVLSAAHHLKAFADKLGNRPFCLLSGGTDGEDGSTGVAGAWIDGHVLKLISRRSISSADYLARFDSFRFFQQTGSLLEVGPTGTNVCDLRVVLVG